VRTSTEGVIELERRIAARPETVFAYFTDPDRYRQWQGVDAELDPRPGGTFRVTMTGSSRAVVRGVYVVVDPPNRVVYTWGWDPLEKLPEDPRLDHIEGLPQGLTGVPPGTSVVEVVLVPDGDSTIIRVRHSGLPTEDARRFHSQGWSLTLPRLIAVASGGDPGPYPFVDI
jgi:uncharacterized protein YndB with AHSA1/START domain